MIHIDVKLFAILRDLTGTDSMKLALPEGSSIEDALRSLFEHKTELNQWKEHVRVAVNCEYRSSSFVLHEGDEIAIIPPVSGG